MSPPVSFTKATLSYPVYSANFDPYNRGFLVVGGGGGEGRSGVGNKITLLDTTSRSSLDVAAEIDLSRDEDSVTSIASLGTTDGLVTLAGINSSEADQKSGKNEHLRAFNVQYPKRQGIQTQEKEQESKGEIKYLGKSALLRPGGGPKPETYQRLLRLSPAQKRQGSKRIGAIGSGLARDSEIIIFDATKTPPSTSEIITRVSLPSEAADLDIAETPEGAFSISWCTDFDVHEQSVAFDFSTQKAALTPRGPRRVHSVSNVDASGQPRKRSKYRSIRFLTPHHLLLLSNLPDKKGAELSILHLYPTGPANLLFHKILPAHVKQGMGLDVCALDSDSSGNRQFVIAVGGQDISIRIYTINYTRATDTFTPFKSFTTLHDVHPLQMTAICLSPFHSPTRAPTPPADSKSQSTDFSNPPPHPLPQYIRLASTSMGNTVVVDTFALSPLSPEKKESRYVLSHPADEKWSRNLYIALISFVVLMTAIIVQSYFAPDQSKALTGFLPPGAREWLHQPANVAQGLGKDMGSAAATLQSSVESVMPAIPKATQRLRDILHLHRSEAESNGPNSKAVVLRTPPSETTDLSVDVIPDREEYIKQDTSARHWHELKEHEKEAWKERLVKAGEWSVSEGETVLKGILFSSYAGFVGQVAGEAIREL